jgi:hypothetical protein
LAESTQIRFSNQNCKVSVDADTWGQVVVSKGHGVGGKFRVDVFYGPKRITVAINGREVATVDRGEPIESPAYNIDAWDGGSGN